MHSNDASLAEPTLPMPCWVIQVPLEVCEAIIDACHSAPWNALKRLRTLRACALVCRAWLPCSRRNLWRRVIVDRPSCCDMLVDVVKTSPELARYIIELEIYGSSGVRHPSLLGIVPRQDRRFPENLQSLKLRDFDFRDYLWHRYNTYLAHFPPIIHLELHNAIFESATDFFGLIWAFPHLTSITLGHTQFRNPLSKACEEKFRNLCTIKSAVHCRNLR
ncbi:hypothetical protein NUW54_g6476 [Trametes sanguinea]|uniref:Uncharacterized protein n=1 Tax=Trametes sanguinea TaxID=158606 RepID=A0ACC1PS84_9APHY|nr:hypothetical protein NUW54_g6476 [Trametes sanguinea]